MHRLALFIAAIVIAIAAAGSFLGASLLASYLERSTQNEIAELLNSEGYDWASVRTDGLIVHISGPAPDEAERFKALSAIKNLVNHNRVRDAVTVVAPDSLHAPRFSLELLRNGDGISLIGLIPESTGRNAILDAIDDVDTGTNVTDMLETTDFPEPDGWTATLNYALDSLRSLPRSKISVVANEVIITAITDSLDEKNQIEAKLLASKPEDVQLVMSISAPRPVITPFSLRYIKDDKGTRFDSCSADTDIARERILTAARATGLAGDADCTVGLGVPSPRWSEAVEFSIRALNELGGGNLTFSDADITLVARENTRQIDFDRVVYNLEQALPDVFSVHAVLPPKPVLEGSAAATETPEFLATKSPEGLVQMRGRVRDQRTQLSITNFSKALFGGENVYDTTRVDSSLPDGWPSKVLAGLQALAMLHNGALIVQPDTLELRGVSDKPDVKTVITKLFSEKLGDSSRYTINVTYEEALNRQVILPTPQECVDAINAILAEKQIAFAPSSTRLEGEGMAVVERISEAMTDCSEVPMEIGGHTDSQGREAMNQTLSQARAEAVLDALLRLEVLTTFLSAKGYGESQPIADNGTEDGRQINRRIEFTLIAPEDTQTSVGAGDAVEADPPSDTTPPEETHSDTEGHAEETQTPEVTDGQD